MPGKNTAFQHTSILVRPRQNFRFHGSYGGAAGYCPRVRCIYCTASFIAISGLLRHDLYSVIKLNVKCLDQPLQIRLADPHDRAAILAILMPVIRAGETYALDRDLTDNEAFDYWMAADKETFVAEDEGAIIGTYYMRRNQPGGGRHVCNCGYMTAAAATGRGVARHMALHSFQHAKSRNFRAMQYNFVVVSNERAVRLWQSLGFAIAGRLPLAFEHPSLGFVDALVMHRAI